jgi:hypothetical protein
MEPIRINPYTLIYIGLGVGLVAGLILLFIGWFNGKIKLGAVGLAASVIGGGLLGLFLVVPVFAVFLWVILRKSPATSPATADAAVADAEQDSSNGV